MSNQNILPEINYMKPAQRPDSLKPSSVRPRNGEGSRSVDADRFDRILRDAQQADASDRRGPDRSERPDRPTTDRRDDDQDRKPPVTRNERRTGDPAHADRSRQTTSAESEPAQNQVRARDESPADGDQDAKPEDPAQTAGDVADRQDPTEQAAAEAETVMSVKRTAVPATETEPVAMAQDAQAGAGENVAITDVSSDMALETQDAEEAVVPGRSDETEAGVDLSQRTIGLAADSSDGQPMATGDRAQPPMASTAEVVDTEGSPGVDNRLTGESAQGRLATTAEADDAERLPEDPTNAGQPGRASSANEQSSTAANLPVVGPQSIDLESGEPAEDSAADDLPTRGRVAAFGDSGATGGTATGDTDSRQGQSTEESPQLQSADADGTDNSDPASEVVVEPASRAASNTASRPAVALSGLAAATPSIGQLTAAESVAAGIDASALALSEEAGDTEPLWSQVRRALGSLRTLASGEQQMTIRLRPAELGSVVVRINNGQDGTAVSLVTESSAAANQLNQQRQQLISELEDTGLGGVNVDIDTEAGTDDAQAEESQADGVSNDESIRGLGRGNGAESDLASGYGSRRGRRPSVGLVDVDL